MLTIPFTVGAIVGAVLVWAGWRGRRIDDHPWCRRRRFDLRERPRQTAPER